MGKEVGINMDVFQSNISKIRSSNSEIKSEMKTSRSFDKTNINPFSKDLENSIKTIELLQKYKTIMEADITELEHIGKQMEENDEKIASEATKSTGTQPMV